jgi:hypothetical protein
MENKYFTPDIEDFYVGYELEVNYNFKLNDIFHKEIIDSFEELSDIHSRMSGDCVIRVPYLTKEQIEAEGWEHYVTTIFKKGNWLLNYNTDSYKLAIIIDRDLVENHCDFSHYAGTCKDINTFRKITKLLEI